MDPRTSAGTNTENGNENALIGAILALACQHEREAGCTARELGLRAVTGVAPGAKVAILHSGGLDSATLLGLAAGPLGLNALALEFARGDRTAESRCARAYALSLGVPFETLSYPAAAGRYPLPERYSIYLVAAAAFAAARGARTLLTGLIYDDWIRGDTAGAAPAIFGAVNRLLAIESPEQAVTVAAPFAYVPKATVAALSLALGIAEMQSFSCETPEDDLPCGDCGQCQSRAHALTEGRKILETVQA